MTAITISLLAWSIVGLILFRVIYERVRDRDLPPGPTRLPLIGNLHQAPVNHAFLTYQKWIRQYGPLVSVQFGGNTVILIGDATIARELLNQRGNIYSDRPRLVMAGENLTKGMHLLLRRYDERYKLHQRLDAPVLSLRASNTYCPLQELESKQLLYDFLSTNDFKKVYARYAASLVYSLAYGMRLATGDEEILKHMHQVQYNFGKAGQVGAWIVDILPFLNHLPMFLAPWKRTAEEFYHIEKSLHVQNMQNGLASKGWNWTKEFSRSKLAEPMSELELAYNIGILADAGLDTTSIQMQMFTLASLAYPAFIPKAQEEIDAVIGPDRLPNFDDRPDLPYIDAVVEEILRWHSIVPGGVPHATLQADRYLGYRIPKGSTVMPVMWAMAHDERTYYRPDEFLPERWLEKSEEGEEKFVNFFGYGRRICTGRYIARNSLFLLIARILWGYNIRHAVSKDGKIKEVDDMALKPGFVTAPLAFEAVFEPRSTRAREVIEDQWHKTDKDVGPILDSIKEEQIATGLTVRA